MKQPLRSSGDMSPPKMEHFLGVPMKENSIQLEIFIMLTIIIEWTGLLWNHIKHASKRHPS
jgi:hypothetical protein